MPPAENANPIPAPAGFGCPPLPLDTATVARARKLAATVADEVMEFTAARTTMACERTVLRLFGVDGATPQGVPLVNACVDRLHREGMLGDGIAGPFCAACIDTGLEPQALAVAIADDHVDLRPRVPRWQERAGVRALGDTLARRGLQRIEAARATRWAEIQRLGAPLQPLRYVIVATGNIHEDVVQAEVAVAQGADVIAVIRSTGQSLLDYVPDGLTTEGYGGTFATRANFALMRKALDAAGARAGRYVRLCNYASGLCMPEIACLGAFERLDMMLNDALYGILFRDINVQRTLVDQRKSRLLSALAGIIINTGEDNYLTTADAVEAAHTVIASTLINEALARRCGLQTWQLGLGHAMEIDPLLPNALLLEIAQAALVRTLYTDAPIKFMPPTKHMTGNVLRGHVQDALFDLVGVLTGQSIQLLGMPTEAMHTPHIHDRYLALEAAQLVFGGGRGLGSEFVLREDGAIVRRAQETLDKALELLEEIARQGLIASLQHGIFADVARHPEGGRGLEGVIVRGEDYWDPSEAACNERLSVIGHLDAREIA
jgi:beta-lysine 5,6-aminomutase alpha subunit